MFHCDILLPFHCFMLVMECYHCFVHGVARDLNQTIPREKLVLHSGDTPNIFTAGLFLRHQSDRRISTSFSIC